MAYVATSQFIKILYRINLHVFQLLQVDVSPFLSISIQ